MRSKESIDNTPEEETRIIMRALAEYYMESSHAKHEILTCSAGEKILETMQEPKKKDVKVKKRHR